MLIRNFYMLDLCHSSYRNCVKMPDGSTCNSFMLKLVLHSSEASVSIMS